ncbi:MAG: flagellar filament capping protein FliD [Phycisphaerales bacterium]
MGGITTGVGLFSGIDTGSLIEQLISIESRPKVLAQTRLIQLQSQQAAYISINSQMKAIENLAKAFRTDNVFKNKQALVSNESLLSATASQDALPGSYNFVVDRLVSSQQMLSRGFSTSDAAAGLSTLTFEGAEARLDRDTQLADLNNGDGITRGTIKINGTNVDLTSVGTVNEVLDAINEVDGVSARVENDKFVIDGVTSISNVGGREVLESLGLDGSIVSNTVTGSSVYTLGTNTSLSTINDGRGLGVRNTSGEGVWDISIELDVNNDLLFTSDEKIQVRLGDIEELVDGELTVTSSAVTTIGGVIGRINDAIEEAGLDGELEASIDEATGTVQITDLTGSRAIQVADNAPASGSQSSAAADLGLAGLHLGGATSGTRIFAGMNTTLVSSLNGGAGLSGTDGDLNFALQDTGLDFTVNIAGLGDINDVINAINNHADNQDGFGGRHVTASLNDAGNGLSIVDNTSGAGTFTISGTTGLDAAAALGLDGSYASGVAGGSDLDLAYIGTATKLDSLYDGDGIGTGTFEIIDSDGKRASFTISDGDETLADVIRRINQSSAVSVTARINDTGDGLLIEDNGAGSTLLEINDTDGTVASKLKIAGKITQEQFDAGDKFIDGSFETTLEFDPNDSLTEVVAAINSSGANVSASILNTGTGSTPFRLSLASEDSGSAGRFLVDSGGFDLGMSTIDAGDDSRVFYGSTNAQDGVLISSSSNQLDGVIQGVTIDLLSTSDEAVEISITQDTESVETKIQEFVDAFNAAVEQIDFQTRYDQETEAKGTLLGDGTVINLRNSMFSQLQRVNDGFESEFSRLSDIGIKVGSGSVLEFDSEKFRTAYAEDPQAVEDLFARRTVLVGDEDEETDPNADIEIEYSERGVMVLFEEFANNYTDSLTGILSGRDDAFDDQIALQESRIEFIDARLEQKREVLTRQFLAMEQAIAGFQTQGSALSQISSIG